MRKSPGEQFHIQVRETKRKPTIVWGPQKKTHPYILHHHGTFIEHGAPTFRNEESPHKDARRHSKPQRPICLLDSLKAALKLGGHQAPLGWNLAQRNRFLRTGAGQVHSQRHRRVEDAPGDVACACPMALGTGNARGYQFESTRQEGTKGATRKNKSRYFAVNRSAPWFPMSMFGSTAAGKRARAAFKPPNGHQKLR